MILKTLSVIPLINITSLAVAFHSEFNCSIVAIIHTSNIAHSHDFIVALVQLALKSAIKSENTTLFVGIVAVFKLYTASHVSFGFKQYVVIIVFYKLIKKLDYHLHTVCNHWNL